VAALLIVVVIIVAAGYWRLSSGPVSLAVLVATIENVINENIDDLTVSIDDLVLEKDGDTGAVQFRFINLRVRDQENKLVARTSRAAFRMSTSDLLSGEFSPTNLELLGPKMFLHRQLDGSFRLGFGDIAQPGSPAATGKDDTGPGKNANETAATASSLEGPESAEDIIALLQATLLSDTVTGPTARLREIIISNAALTLYDEPNATTWASPNANVTITRAKDGLTANVAARIKVGEETFGFTVEAAYQKSNQNILVKASVEDVNPDTLARHIPDLAMLKILRLPVSGTASLEVALDGKMLNAGLDIKLGAGKLIFSEKQADEIGVSAGRITLKYDQDKRLLVIEPSLIELSGGKASLSGHLIPEGDSGNPFSRFGYNLELANIKVTGKKTVEIDRIIAIGSADTDSAVINLETTELHAGEGRISVSGTIEAKAKAPVFKLSGNVENIASAKLLEIWPLEVAPGLRVWIKDNLVAFVPRGSFEVDIDGEDIAKLIAGNEVPKDFIKAEFEAQDATIRYFEGLPPMAEAYGRGVLLDGDFTFYGDGGVATVASGKKVELTKARFHTNWAISDPAIGTVTAFVKGSASAVMELLDNNPLNFAGKMGVNPKTMGGQAVGELVFTMPLLAELPVEKVDIKAKAKLTGIKIPKAFGEFDLTKGNLNLDITMFGLKGVGTINIKDTKAALIWAENFGVKGKRQSEFKLQAVLDDAARARMGINLTTFMRGPAAVDFTLKGNGADLNQARVEADLSKATLFRDAIGWTSPPGGKTTAGLDMTFIKGGAIAIKNIKVVSESRNIFVAGNLNIDASGNVSKFDLPEIRMGRLTRYGVRAERGPDGVLDVIVRGASLDARKMITNVLKKDRIAPVYTKNKNRDVVRLSANFETVYAHNKQVFKNLAVSMDSIGDSVVAIKAAATHANSKSFTLDYGDKAGETYNLVIGSKDAGATLKAFDLYSKIQKGRLILRASITPAGRAKPSTGYLRIKDFNIANDDRLKDLTQTFVNEDEEFETILRDSVAFSSFRMPFELVKNRLLIGNSILKGAVLGASGRGNIDTKTNALNVEGTLIPVYAVNSIVGNIPVLGRLLVGRKGEGVFGVTFSLRGTTAKPRFSINPVSALAPGFLRQFFEKGTPQPAADKLRESGPVPLQAKPKRRKKKADIVESGGN